MSILLKIRHNGTFFNRVPLIIFIINNILKQSLFKRNNDLEVYNEYKVEGKSIHCILVRSEIDKSSFAFGTLVLGLSK